MRVLLLTKRHRFLNPTRELLISALGSEFVTVGPGYGPICNTIGEYSRQLGRFDAVIVDSSIYLSKGHPQGQYAWPDADGHTFADLFDHFKKIVVLNLLDDFHGSTEWQYQVLLDDRVFVLSTAVGYHTYRYERFAAAARESWFRYDVRRIPRALRPGYLLFPAALDDSEFSSTERTRDDRVAVLGVQYFIRRRIAAQLRQEGIGVVTGDDWLFRALRAIAGRTGWLTSSYRGAFLRALDRAKVAVTCSGTVGYPIRKYFEIPARRAALVAEFFDDPEALGFRTGVNCMALQAEDGADAPEIIRRLLADDAERRRLVDAGYELIWSRHRIRHRVEQLRQIMAAIASDDLITARWHDGRLQLVLHSEQALSPAR